MGDVHLSFAFFGKKILIWCLLPLPLPLFSFPQILWLQYRWTWWAAVLVIISILAWFATACVYNMLTVDFEFFMVSVAKRYRHKPRSHRPRPTQRGIHLCVALLSLSVSWLSFPDVVDHGVRLSFAWT